MEASALRAPVAIAPRRPAGVLLRLRTDDQLVALFRQGNEDAFRVIHDRYRQRLSAYARQMLGGSTTDADDAMQDVFLRAYAALRADERPLALRAWLYRVAHNRCIDHLRRPASQPTLELSEEVRPLPATTGDPILAAERSEDLRRLVTDVRALPPQQRSALLMRELEGLSYRELAGALNITIPAVKSLLVRARMGLVEGRRARDAPCREIRADITAAYDRGVRASGRARRHARECPACAGYRTTLKGITAGLGALAPSPGIWGSLAKLAGLGAGGSGAAGGAAAAGGGAAGASGTAIAGAAAATKFAAAVCCAAVLGGGVEAATEHLTRSPAPAASRPAAPVPAASARVAAPPAAWAPGVPPRRAVTVTRGPAGVPVSAAAPGADPLPAVPAGGSSPSPVAGPDGGALAPAEDLLPGAGGAGGAAVTGAGHLPVSGALGTAGPDAGAAADPAPASGTASAGTAAHATGPAAAPAATPLPAP